MPLSVQEILQHSDVVKVCPRSDLDSIEEVLVRCLLNSSFRAKNEPHLLRLLLVQSDEFESDAYQGGGTTQITRNVISGCNLFGHVNFNLISTFYIQIG